jgi:photosystem II stability/assembly factor-like uncharacterized protein
VKKVYVILLLLIAILFVRGLYGVICPATVSPRPPKPGSSQGGKSNPQGRSQYEFLRHFNPQTGNIPTHISTREKKFIESRFLVPEHVTSRAKKKQLPQLEEWELLGPQGLGGRTRALAIDVADTNEKTILAGGVSGGMWKTKNGGATWYRTSALTETPSVSCLIQDKRPNKQHIWYYGTGEQFSINDLESDNGVIRGSGIFKSIDNGETWNPLSSTRAGSLTDYDNSFDYVWSLGVDASNTLEDELYAATAGGIYRSIDGGNTWARVLGNGDWSGRYTDIVVSTSGTVYATISNIRGNTSSPSGIFRSEDGIHWQTITPAWWPLTYNRIVATLCPSNQNKLYIIADLSTLDTKKHLLASYQHPDSWTDLSENIPDYDYDLGDYDSQVSFNMVLAVHPSNENIVFLGGTNLYRSDDGFSSNKNTHWIGGYDPQKQDLSKYPAHHPDQHGIVFFKNPAQMLVAHDGGISITQDNAKPTVDWKFLNENYTTTQFYTVALNQSSTDFRLVGGMQDNGTYGTKDVTNRAAWESLLAGDGSFCAIANNGLRSYVSSQYGRIYRLDYDGGGTYRSFARVDPAAALPYLFINPFVLDPYNSNIMYLAGGQHIWRNNNLASIPTGSDEATLDYWKRIDATATNNSISALAVSTQPSNVLYYGTSRGRLYRVENPHQDQPFVTEITGANFPKYFGNPVGYISSIAVDHFDAQKVLVTFSNYGILSIFYSDTGGSTWTTVAGNLEEEPNGNGAGPAVYSAAMLQLNDGPYYFVGTSSGLFGTPKLEDAGTKWEKLSQEVIGNAIVYMVTARQKDGTVLAASHGNGLFARHYTNTIPTPFEPLSTELSQNYPNPFQASVGTTITFRLDETQFVVLDVVDASGKKIATLQNGSLDANAYSIRWDQPVVPPGIYYYRLRAGAKTLVRRMVAQ